MMKKTLLLFATLFLANTGFFAQAVFPDAAAVVNYLKGNWRWVKSCGGISGGCITPANTPPGPQSVVFSLVAGASDSIGYTFYKNSQVEYAGRARVSYANTIFGPAWRFNMPAIGSLYPELSVFMAKTDSVWLNEGCHDCYQRSYVRQTVVVGVEEAGAAKALKVFPNPACNVLSLNLEGNLPVTVCLFDATGKELVTSPLAGNRLDVQSLAQGLYFLRVRTSSADYTATFIKQ
jgi:hypothetical protein